MLIKRYHKTRKKWVWDVRLIDEHGKKRLYPSGHTSKKMAEKYEQKLRNEIAERRMFPEQFPERKIFKEFVPDYLKKHAASLRSHDFYAVICTILTRTFGERYLHEITRYDVETYQAERSQHVGACMVNRELTILKGIFTKAIDWGFLFKNPVKGIKLAKEIPRMRYLNQDEIRALVEACGRRKGESYLKPMVIIDIHTGMRKNEILNVKKEDVDLEHNVLKVREAKGGVVRFVPIDGTAKAEFTKLINKGHSEYLFHDKKGEAFADVKKSFASAVKAAGLSDVTFHDLRKTFATWCVFRGVPAKTLQKWMGHRKIETTMKYYVVSSEDFEQEAIKRLDGLTDSYRDTSKKEAVARTA